MTPLTHWKDSATYPRQSVMVQSEDFRTTSSGPFPWDDLSAGGKGINLQTSVEQYAKMKWVTENVPKMSLLKIARQGVEAETNRLIALHYKK